MTSSAATRPAPVTFVQLELTSECVPFSRSPAYIGTLTGAPWIPIEGWKQIIASAADAGVELIQFTGSRSAMFPDLVAYALAAGVKVDVHSPLVHVSEGMWELLALPEVSLGICWYAAEPLRHTEITGTEGSWFHVRQNTVKALDGGLSPRVEIVTLNDGQPLSQARAELNRLGITSVKVDRARSVFIETDVKREGLCGGCGTGRAGVTWFGAVVPCLALGRSLIVGDVKATPLGDIVRNPVVADVLASFSRDQTHRSCSEAALIECRQRPS